MLDRAVIEAQVMVGAGSLVPPGKVQIRVFVHGAAVKVSATGPRTSWHLQYSAEHYLEVKQSYRS